MEEIANWVDYFQKNVEIHLAPPRDQGRPIIPYIGILPQEPGAEPILWSVVLEPANVSRQFRCLAGMMLVAWNAEAKRAAFVAELEAELQRCGPHAPVGAPVEQSAIDTALDHLISLVK